ncbi:unnamed protein product [Lactuca saligna]|uniref:H15 domain-containing protein n=1 Tax=Lactuca saligna TaxID=75948 RepID=A0AA35YL99_LACSI|nr:unnamed protein product [Lactuca saligna]
MVEPQTDSSAPAGPQTDSPASPYQVLPKYPEMIFAAIEAVDVKNGANKSAISKQIEDTYGSLPAAHSTLLSHHLNKMKASGELIIVKNNYVKPDPNASPKRGRGRPAKPKEPLPEGIVVSPPRPRGRPPKPRDPLAPVTDSTPRPRGRPKKVQDPLAQTPVKVGPSRPRGRPPNPDSAAKKAAQSLSGRKRGRPPKVGGASTASKPPPPSGERRGRGRPPKVQTPAAAPVGDLIEKQD